MEPNNSTNESAKPANDAAETLLEFPDNWDLGRPPAATVDQMWRLSPKIRHLDKRGPSTPVSAESPIVQPESQACGVQVTANEMLRLGVLALDRRHHPRTCLPIDDVSHGDH